MVAGLIHNSRRHDVSYAGIQNTAGHVMQLIDLIADDDGVPRICSAQEPHDDIKLRAQQIDKFPFGFVAPLQSNHTSSRHSLNSTRRHGSRPVAQAKRTSLGLGAVGGQ